MAMTPLHMAAGLAIGVTVHQPWLSIPLAFLSHLVLDLYPEWGNSDRNFTRPDGVAIFVELILGTVAFGALVALNRWELYACVVAANLIDLWDFIVQQTGRRKMWCCHGGTFPFYMSWPCQEMTSLQTAVLDATLVTLLLALVLR